MTLIAGFKCHGGVVICADTKETVEIPGRGNYRVRVSKIQPRQLGGYEVVIGGAGWGNLVDGLSRILNEQISQWPPDLDNNTIEQLVQTILWEYHSTHVAMSGTTEPLDFIFCLKRKGVNDNIILWEFRDTVIIPKDAYSLLGWEEAIYAYEVDWLYRSQLPLAQGVLLGVRLFSMAKDTSDYIGGDTQVIVVTEREMHLEKKADVARLEERVERFNNALARLVRAAPDVSMSHEEFNKAMRDFQDRVIQLRKYYTHEACVNKLLRAMDDPNYVSDPYPLVSGDDFRDFLEDSNSKGLRITKPPPDSDLPPQTSTWLKKPELTDEQKESLLKQMRESETKPEEKDESDDPPHLK